jgi:CubicO group peptidase (beta-lactamase class C family)
MQHGGQTMGQQLPKVASVVDVHRVLNALSRGALIFVITSQLLSCSSENIGDKNFEWQQYEDPEQAGWSSDDLEKAYSYSRDLKSSAVMVIYKGKVLVSWGDIEEKYKAHSIRKAFLSALYGINVDKGIIDLDMTLEELKIDDITPLSSIEKMATIENLLQSSSGIYLPAQGDGHSMKVNKPERGSHSPGEHFHYNNWDFNALGTIYQKVTGNKIFDDFLSDVSEPLGMEDFSLADTEMRTVDFTSHDYYSFRISSRDLARFGLLYQQMGVWNGERILSEEWVTNSTKSQIGTGHGGWGYLWATLPRSESEKFGFKSLSKYDIYFKTGIGVHIVAVVPELDLVFIHRFDSDNYMPEYEKPPVFNLLSLIIDAKTGTPKQNPRLKSLSSSPFPEDKRLRELPNKVTLDKTVLDRYTGTYDFHPAIIRIVREGDHLQLLEKDGEIFDNLYPETENVFYYEYWDRKLEFVSDTNGEVTHYNRIIHGIKEKATKME